MSQSGISRKLQPAKKALKRFTTTFQSKLHNLNFHKAIKVIKSNTNRIIAYCSVHLFLPFKKRFLTKQRPRHGHRYQYLYQSYTTKNQQLRNISPIYIDQLYQADQSQSAHAKHFQSQAGTSGSRGKQVVNGEVLARREGKTAKEKILYSVEDAWREAVAKSPQLRPVDERADEFIYNFRQEIQLQKERSITEFEEMLARSA